LTHLIGDAMTVALAVLRGVHDAHLFAGEHTSCGPGQYSFGDFVKVGVPFTFIVALVTVMLVPISLPFR
jgi:hypothetical protein